MEWRSAGWSAGWAWLEPVLVGVAAIALSSALARVRVRIRRRPRRSLANAPLRRIITLLGLGFAFYTSAASASGRTSAHPGRSGRPIPEAPWSGTSGFFPPPHPLVPPGSQMAESPKVHPAIHKRGATGTEAPLFERAERRRSRERDESRRLHPAGNPRSVELERTSSVTVHRGDCLWTIAAETVDSDDPQRVDGYWRAIFRLNHSVIGSNPDHLLPGQVLRLPREATG
ncbi:hypothetical protein BH20ACT23_BH20ACT23_25280 [soil metagenome]